MNTESINSLRNLEKNTRQTNNPTNTPTTTNNTIDEIHTNEIYFSQFKDEESKAKKQNLNRGR